MSGILLMTRVGEPVPGNAIAETDRPDAAAVVELHKRMLTGIRFIALCIGIYTCQFAAGVLVPLVLAILLALALAPLVRMLQLLRIPPAIGAALVVLSTVATLIYGIAVLSAPAADWVENAPLRLQTVERKLVTLLQPVEAIGNATREVEEIASSTVGESEQDVVEVKIRSRSFLDTALSGTPRALATVVAVVFFVYFLLAAGRRISAKVASLVEHRYEEVEIAAIAHQVQRDVSRYLFTVGVINLGLGVATGLLLWISGVSNPLLWAVVVAVFNFAPYVGAVVSTILIAVVTLLQFEAATDAVLVTLTFALFTVLEGQLITPMILGRRFSLSPYVLFAGILFLGWLWGIAGVLLAVPLLVCLRIAGELMPTWHWLAVLMRREASVEDTPIATGRAP